MVFAFCKKPLQYSRKAESISMRHNLPNIFTSQGNIHESPVPPHIFEARQKVFWKSITLDTKFFKTLCFLGSIEALAMFSKIWPK